MELIRTVTTVRDLLTTLQSAPDYMLDLPVECVTPDGMEDFMISLVEVVDIIEEGNRVTFVRVTGECN